MRAASGLQGHWNVQSRIVKKKAVGVFSVLTKAFAVIAGDDDDRIVIDARFFQEGNPVGHGRIGVCDLPVVKMVFVFFGKRRGRFVGIVRIIEMHPHEVGSRGVFLKPSLGVIDDFHAAAFDAAPTLLVFSVSILAIAFRKVVVKIETAIEAGSEGVAVENYGSNKSRGVVAMFF